MSTKFTKLVKIKKDAVKQIENVIQKIHYDISVNEEEKQNSIDALNRLSAPSKGSFQDFLSFEAQKEAIKQHILRIIAEKKVLDDLLSTQQSRHKLAMMEHEKMLYLENKEIADILKEVKRKERIDMDEISNILYTNKKKKIT